MLPPAAAAAGDDCNQLLCCNLLLQLLLPVPHHTVRLAAAVVLLLPLQLRSNQLCTKPAAAVLQPAAAAPKYAGGKCWITSAYECISETHTNKMPRGTDISDQNWHAHWGRGHTSLKRVTHKSTINCQLPRVKQAGARPESARL